MSDNLSDIQKENAKLRAQADELAAQNAQLQKELEANPSTPVKIKGEFTAKWKTPMGKDVSQKFSFAPGHKFLWLNGFKVPTEEVIAAANGKEVDEVVLKEHPWMNKKVCSEHLTLLAKSGYGYLEER